LYSRFWHKFLYDIGIVSTPEPYKKRTSHGLVLGENGEKMSKSRGNVVNPDTIVDEIGADAFRLYEMFMGAFDQPIPWSTTGAKGCKRFLDRVWRLQDMLIDKHAENGIRDCLKVSIHSTIKKVSEDYERMKFNTAIAAMMSLVNDIYSVGSVTYDELKTLIILLYPVAPHICEEINENMGYTEPLHHTKWVEYDESALVENTVEMAVQVNGKVRGKINVASDAKQDEIEKIALASDEVKPFIESKTIRKIIVVRNIVNIVV